MNRLTFTATHPKNYPALWLQVDTSPALAMFGDYNWGPNSNHDERGVLAYDICVLYANIHLELPYGEAQQFARRTYDLLADSLRYAHLSWNWTDGEIAVLLASRVAEMEQYRACGFGVVLMPGCGALTLAEVTG